MIDQNLTKRQHEILERLEQGMAVKQIATDLGVSRNAVYLQIERLRNQGVLPAGYTPSGQPPRTPLPAPIPGLTLGAAVPAPGFSGGPLPGHRSELAGLRRPAGDEMPVGEYARLIEAAVARGDAVALAYELGRLDATEAEELATGLVESALERLRLLPADGGEEPTTELATTQKAR
jgi:DNA-binding transcriptional MocR family regulator